MLNARITMTAGLLAFCLAGPAGAQDLKPLQPADYVNSLSRNIAESCSTPAAAEDTSTSSMRLHRQGDNGEVNPFPIFYAIRGGAMVSPRIKALAGVDVTLPALGLGRTSVARIDADILFDSNFAGSRTAVPVTFDEIYRVPGGQSPYLGFGLGAFLGQTPKFMAKLLVGFPVAKHLAIEGDADWIGNRTVILALARLKF